jgi:hypothetical protein
MPEKSQNDTSQPSEGFKSAESAATFLVQEGWKVSERTLYDHWKKGKIKSDFDKRGFSKKNLLKYASNNLNLGQTLLKEKDEGMSRRKLAAEVEKIEEQAKREKISRLKDEGELIERPYVYQQFAALVVGLENAAKGQAMTEAEEAAEIIVEATNKPAKFVEIFNDILDRALNEMAKSTNMDVLFGEEE